MLTLSSKVRYATRILVFIAGQSNDKPISTKKISEAENISFDYTEQILIRLKVAKLVKSIRGPKGGFVLTRLPEHISIADIISVIEGDINITSCLSEYCPRSNYCQVRSLWERANKALTNVFSRTTVNDLVNNLSGNQERKL